MILTDLEAAVYAWVNGTVVDGTTVYWREPGKGVPSPKSPKIRLKLLGPRKVGLDELMSDDSLGDEEFRIVGDRLFTLSCNAYGDTAMQALSDLITSVSDPTVMAILNAAGISILSEGSPRDLTELLETKYEQRYQVDFEIAAREDLVVAPGSIESVELASEVGDQESTIKVESP